MAPDQSELIPHFTGDDMHRLSDQLLGMGVKILCIKCGPRGYYCRTAGKDQLALITTAGRLDSTKCHVIFP